MGVKGAFGTNLVISAANRKYLIVGEPTLNCTNGGGTVVGAIQIFIGIM